MLEGRILTLDEKRIIERAREYQKRIAARLEK
jgi:hypothetical protein